MINKVNDLNILVIHSGSEPSSRTLKLVEILKGRAENENARLKFTYEPFSSGKIKGKTWDEAQAFYDEVSSLDID